MKKQVIDVDGYWLVVVFYNVDYDLFGMIFKELNDMGMNDKVIMDVYESMRNHKAKAVTCSNIVKKQSVVLFNYHDNVKDYLNSIVHEAEHVKQAMLEAYEIEDAGEPPAYTIGYLVMKMVYN